MGEDLYTIVWMGYNDKPNYDRIWGHLIMKDGRQYVFFGVRNKKILFKQHYHERIIENLKQQQYNKGFKEISIDRYKQISLDFKELFDICFMESLLMEAK